MKISEIEKEYGVDFKTNIETLDEYLRSKGYDSLADALKYIEEKKEFFLVEEVAEKLRVSNMTIYRYIQSGKLKAHKIGKEFRISEMDYSSFLDKSKVGSSGK